MSLYKDEFLRTCSGYPALCYYSQPSEKKHDKNKSLVLYCTGGAHLARVSYCKEKSDPKDFLAHWFKESGHPFLAVSYPIEHPVFEKVYPEFNNSDRANQLIASARDILEKHNLGNKVILLLWSWAGLLTDHLVKAANEVGVEIEFFVMMAATPQVSYLTEPFIPFINKKDNGLGTFEDTLYPLWYSQLAEINKINNKQIVPDDVYKKEVLGAFPVGIGGTSYDYNKEYFVENRTNFEVIGDLSLYPEIFVLNHNSRLDIKHAVSDSAYWGLFVDRQIQDRILRPNTEALKSLPKNKVDNIFNAIDSYKKDSLKYIDGNHFFFMGELGAKKSCDLVLGFIKARNKFKKLLQDNLM